jgi:hypothetical protein
MIPLFDVVARVVRQHCFLVEKRIRTVLTSRAFRVEEKMQAVWILMGWYLTRGQNGFEQAKK